MCLVCLPFASTFSKPRGKNKINSEFRILNERSLFMLQHSRHQRYLFLKFQVPLGILVQLNRMIRNPNCARLSLTTHEESVPSEKADWKNCSTHEHQNMHLSAWESLTQKGLTMGFATSTIDQNFWKTIQNSAYYKLESISRWVARVRKWQRSHASTLSFLRCRWRRW